MFSRFLIIIFFWIQIIYGQCFDTEITEADFPYNHLADLTLQDDDWNQLFSPMMKVMAILIMLMVMTIPTN